MDLFAAGRDQSAADQSNNLAEGHPLIVTNEPFHCANPNVRSLCREYANLCFPQQEPTMCLLS